MIQICDLARRTQRAGYRNFHNASSTSELTAQKTLAFIVSDLQMFIKCINKSINLKTC